MYSVFVVDDEMIVRESLRSKLNWEEAGFTFAGEAADGEIALSMIQDIKPDILITDIRMPFMDGLELSARVKKMQPWIRIIILSGHDEFDYAKRAISIGVDEYLLKPFTLEELRSSLGKVARALEKEQGQLATVSPAEAEAAASSGQTKLLTDFVYGSISPEQLLQQAAGPLPLLTAGFFTLSISELHADQPENRESTKDSLLSLRSGVLKMQEQLEHTAVFFLTPTLFVGLHSGSTERHSEERAFSFANLACHELTHRHCTIVTAISRTTAALSELPPAFTEANEVIKHSRFTGKNRIISTADVAESADGTIVLQENDPLFDRLQYADESELDQIVSEYIALLGENSGHFSIIASYLLVDVIMAVSKVIEHAGGDVKEVMPEILTHSFVDKAVENEEVFIQEVRRILAALLAYRNEHVQGKSTDVILKAKRYIESNYASPDICLHSAAEAVHLSPNHFSTVFSQDCGLTFIEYLTRVRVEQAKKMLLSGEMKSADIAYAVGFNDPHYFSFIFKKAVGLSPREWRAAQGR